MKTSSPPHPATDLEMHLYYQIVYTLGGLLPPPLDDTPEARYTKNLAAIAKVAALLPVNANEVDLAAQCIAAWAQAEEMLRLNTQYASMVRTALAVQGRLMRVQAVRQKREATEGTANQDAWTRHVVERSMLVVADPDAARQQAARPELAPVAVPVVAPAACVDPRIEKNVSKNGINSQNMAFETYLSMLFWNQRSKGSGDTGLSGRVAKGMAEAIAEGRAEARLAGRDLPAKGPEQS